MTRNYTELCKLKTMRERFDYLQIGGKVGEETFGFDRWLNQIFYKLPEWLTVRNDVIVRDLGCDLGLTGYDIEGKIYVHHMNPFKKEDLLNDIQKLLDPEFLICTSKLTHDAIHYGNADLLPKDPVVRTPYDTCPWKQV